MGIGIQHSTPRGIDLGYRDGCDRAGERELGWYGRPEGTGLGQQGTDRRPAGSSALAKSGARQVLRKFRLLFACRENGVGTKQRT